MVSTIVTKTQTVKTYKGRWWWRSTLYRSVSGYTKGSKPVTSYFTIHVCCEGYEGDATQDRCLPISGPEEKLTTTTENGEPDISPSSETTTRELPRTSTSRPSSTVNNSPTTLQINETARGMEDGLGMMSSRTRRQTTIILLSFAIVIVLSVALGCIVYRRRKRSRIQKEVNRVTAEPLRDLSEKSSNIQHFSPSFAPDDEYALVDKTPRVSTPTEVPRQAYENTCIGGEPVDLQSDGQNKEPQGENLLLHTMLPSSTGCDGEVDHSPPNSASGPDYAEGAMNDEYGADDSKLTYDHLDRSPTKGNTHHGDYSKEGPESAGGIYNVLVQSDSAESQDNYDALQRNMWQKEQSGIGGCDPGLDVPSPGSNTDHVVDADDYDVLERVMPKTMGREHLGELHRSPDEADYGHLGSSLEMDIKENDDLDMMPIYYNGYIN
ncbi:uncharacterized protein LOC121411545 [Lytechinus variegatus]|uniref:uncharacterized protein LOC121411545 n=1 Tax=Lytechinus variegatus TaxID=7654 RepID=UPI001BB27EF2|nr:uncharacterized protein LOC121411545 [Lytechinus variegatus]